MYAVIQTGGKQYRVTQGDTLDIERLVGVSSDAPQITFEDVLMVAGDDDVRVGAPHVGGAKVTGRLLAEVRGPKITVFKRKKRKQYRRKTGHRQDLHRVRIENIEA